MKRVADVVAELQENTEALKTKMSELQLYCDLLLQQVHKIKESDELGDTAEVSLRSGWDDEMREAAVGVTLQYKVAHLQLAGNTTPIFKHTNRIYCKQVL